MDAAQREHFAEHGWVRVRDAVPPELLSDLGTVLDEHIAAWRREDEHAATETAPAAAEAEELTYSDKRGFDRSVLGWVPKSESVRFRAAK